MNIITDVPKYSSGEKNAAFWKHVDNEFQRERNSENVRENQSAKESWALKGTRHPVLGEPVAVMPHREFFRLVKKYGHATVHSKEFLKDWNKRYSHLSPNTI